MVEAKTNVDSGVLITAATKFYSTGVSGPGGPVSRGEHRDGLQFKMKMPCGGEVGNCAGFHAYADLGAALFGPRPVEAA